MLASYFNIIVLFMIILLGYFLTYKKLFNQAIADVFSKFVLTIALPLEIFLRITRSFSRSELLDLLKSISLPILTILTMFVISLLFRKILRIDPKDRGVFSLASASSSAIFFGLPIVMAVFGDKGTPYALLYYICNGIFFWSFGVFLLNKDSEMITGKKGTFSVKNTIKGVISPSLITYIVAIGLVLIGIHIPNFFSTFCSYVGGMTSPMAMLFTGIIIAVYGFRSLKFSKKVLGVLIARYMIAPIVVFILSKILPASTLMVQVCLIQASMPVANSIIILAEQKKADISFATASLSYSILIYLFVIPGILFLMKFY